MNKLIPFALFLGLLLNTTAYSQKIDSLWTFDHDSISNNSFDGNAFFDDVGNAYLCISLGHIFNNTPNIDIEFGPGETRVEGQGYRIIKYDKNFQLLWYKNMPGDLALFMSASHEDRIYLSGTFEDTVDFNPDPNQTVNRISRNKESYFLLEMDSSGNFKRVAVFEGLKSGVFFGNFQKLNVRRNSDHSLFVHNSIEDSLDLDPGVGKIPIGGRIVTTPTSYSTYVTSFLVHLDSNFNYIKHINVPNGMLSPIRSAPLSFLFTQGKIFLSGHQRVPIFPDRNQPLLEIQADSGKDFIVIEYDEDFNYIGFKKPFYGTEELAFDEIIPGQNGEIYLFGTFTGTLTIDPTKPEFIFNSAGWSDALVLKFNNIDDFVPLAAYQVGGAYYEWPIFHGFLNQDQIIVEIYMASETNNAPSPDFDPGPDTTLVDKNPTHGRAIVRLDKNLNFRWAGSIRQYGDFFILAITPKNDTSLFLMGLIRSEDEVDLDLSWNKSMVSAYHNFTRFVFVDYLFSKPSYHSAQSTICGQDSFKFKHNYLRQSGSYTNTFSGSDSRDSVVTLDLTVHPSYFMQETALFCPEYVENWHGQPISSAGYYYDSLKTTLGCDSVFRKEVSYRTMNAASIQQSGPNLLVATSGFTSYQWVDCYANYTHIQGAEQDFYQTPHGGLFGAIVTDQNGCSDTTNCIQVQGVGLYGFDPSSVSVYPNPFSDVLHIDGLQPGATLRLVNTLGMEVFYSRSADTSTALQLGDLPSGIYFLEIDMDGERQRVKVVRA